ncbi:hypothetical protein N665_0921s0002 [Sinapis alba]|nr:hypothetical protein N665_0921s0002 [Sinapis alba]
MVHKKKGCALGISSVNNVPRATLSYGQRRDDETAHLRSELSAMQAQVNSLKKKFNVVAAGNPLLENMLQARRAELGIPHPSSTEEEADLERKSHDFFSEFPNP